MWAGRGTREGMCRCSRRESPAMVAVGKSNSKDVGFRNFTSVAE